MKATTRLFATSCVFAFIGVLQIGAQPFSPVEPIVVQIADVDRDQVQVISRIAFAGSTFPEESGFLGFQYLNKRQSEVVELLKHGLKSKGPVVFMDGSKRVAECRLTGRGSFVKSEENMRFGLWLQFDTIERANLVAATIRGEDVDEPTWEDILEQSVLDRSTWKL